MVHHCIVRARGRDPGGHRAVHSVRRRDAHHTWFFNNTRGSLLIVTFLHASQNAWANLLSDNSARPFYFTVGALVIVAVIVVVTFGPARLSRKQASELPLPIDTWPVQAK